MFGVYSQDNVAYRQHLANSLVAIRNEIIAIDNLSADVLKSGEQLLGYTGTYTNEDVADAATELDIAEGKIAYVNGMQIVGVAGIAKYALTIDATGTGTGTVEVNTISYTVPVNFVAGSAVVLTATAAEGSVFVNWTIDGVEVNVDEEFTYFTTKADVTIVANFNLA